MSTLYFLVAASRAGSRTDDPPLPRRRAAARGSGVIATGAVVRCVCRHRPVLLKQSDTHVLIRRGKAWWLIEGKLKMLKCGECGRVVEGKTA